MANKTAAGIPGQGPRRHTNHPTTTVAQSETLAGALGFVVDLIADAVAERLGRSRYMTPEQITEEFGITARAQRDARRRGELVGRRIGHSTLYQRGDVETWLSAAPIERASTLPDGNAVDRARAAWGAR